MTVELDHTVLPARDKTSSAEFLASILGVEASAASGPFLPIEVANGVTLDYMDSDDFRAHHYAFLVSEEEFDAIFTRIEAAEISYYADPGHRGIGELNHRHGRRGFYFDDPNGHAMEVISNPRMRVQKATSDDTPTWQRVGDGQQIFTGDVVDATTNPDAKMTVGFARVGQGETLDMSFPYDEVLILTKGTFTVRTDQHETRTAKAGDFIYLPAESSNIFHATEDTEMVYVANPPAVYAQHVARAAAGQ